jgi:HD superfamily phosphohydrolase
VLENSVKESIRSALYDGFSEPIRDVLWGHIYLTPELELLSKSAAFMRLTRIMQLGPTLFTYPGATHTRASHSLGVYHLAKRLLIHLASLGADEWMSSEGVKSFLCAALLHDVGHFPYTHSLKELPLANHEKLTGKIILNEPMKSLVALTGADPYLSAAIADTNLPSNGNEELLFYRRLLSGVLDPDKLDYLNRDARNCGVPYGAQDVDFIIGRLHPDKKKGVVIDSRGIPSVESILFSKYLMYRTVYWHKSVRSATAMIKKALIAGLKSGTICDEDLYNLDDQELFQLLETKNHPLFHLAGKVKQGELYPVLLETPFDENKHHNLIHIHDRTAIEIALSEKLSEMSGLKILPEDIIVDLPEPFSLETDLFVQDEHTSFSSSSSVFNTSTVKNLENALRIIRIFINPIYEKPLKDHSCIKDIVNL